MINKFKQVTKDLYRGGAPSPKDVLFLKEKFNINKIISLDKKSSDKINRTCKLLKIKHITIDINSDKLSLINLLKYNLKELLLEDGPTYIHCYHGKDRTGLAIALLKCKYMGEDPLNAINEAKLLGFGEGVNPDIVHLYEKLINECKPESDSNNADIVSNQREYISDNRSSPLDEGHQGSFAPYLSKTRQDPIDSVYIALNDQSPTRENYKDYKSITEHDNNGSVPLVGVFNNDAGIRGAGPTEPVGGFIYE